MRNTLLSRDYRDCRLVYEWKGVDTLAQYVKVETLNEIAGMLILNIYIFSELFVISFGHQNLN